MNFANYLHIRIYAVLGGRAGDCLAAIVGAGLKFLWFNTYPAQVFMGDVGSLAIGRRRVGHYRRAAASGVSCW